MPVAAESIGRLEDNMLHIDKIASEKTDHLIEGMSVLFLGSCFLDAKVIYNVKTVACCICVAVVFLLVQTGLLLGHPCAYTVEQKATSEAATAGHALFLDDGLQ